MIRWMAGAITLTLAISLAGLTARAQTNFGRISGSVTDQTGGAVAGTTVTVTDTQRGVSRTLITDDSGQYAAPNLTPGTYAVRAQAQGFRAVERQNIQVLTGAEITVDLTLLPGEQTQTITVTEELPLVNTTSAVINSTIENLDISELPINGRNYVGLSDLRPGIQTNPGGGTDARRSNGQNSENNIWLMDGLSDRGIYGGNPVLGAGNLAGEGATLVPLDTIQEVAFAENPKAEYGFGTGAVINIGFKSGTNALHGTAYAFGRFSALEAQNPFATQKPDTSLEQFGNSIGGPLKKDKIFFFGGYEGKRVNSSTTVAATLPTTAPLGGSTGSANSFPDAIADIQQKIAAGVKMTNGNPIVISPLSLALAGCTLGPPVSCDASKGLFNNNTQSTNVPVQIPNFQHTDNFLVKLDDHLSDKHSVHGEYFLGTGDTYSNCGSPVQVWWGCATPVRGQGVTIVHVWTPNSSWVNELRGGWHRFNQIIGIGECQNYGAIGGSVTSVTGKSGLVAGSPDYVQKFGLVTGSAQPCAMPFLTISTFTGLGNQARGYEPRLTTAWKFNDGLSWTHGKHLTKFGVELAFDTIAGGARGSSQGVLNFGGTGGTAFAGASNLESFLVGFTNTSQILTGDPSTNVAVHYYAGYVQDDWRITPKFTANLGLRYEFQPPMSEAQNRFAIFTGDKSVSPTGIVQVNATPGAPKRLYQPDRKNFAPRLGFAWDLSGKGTTVLRGGAGWMYMTIAYSGLLGNGNVGPNNTPDAVPFYGTDGQLVPGPVNGTQTSAIVSFPAGSLPWAPNTPIFPALGSLKCGPGAAPGATIPAGFTAANAPQQCAVGGFDPHLTMPRMYYWNVDVQHSLPGNMSLDVAYVGNRDTKIFLQSNINQPRPGYANNTPTSILPASLGGGTSFVEQLRQPFYSQFPWIGAVRWFSNIGFSRYNSMQVTFTKRASHGLNFTATYVLANSKDIAAGLLGSSNFADNYNPAGDYGPTNVDPRHRITFTGTWALPSRPAPLQLLSGWRLNTVVYVLSRIPMGANDTTDDISGTGVRMDRWSLVGNPKDFEWGHVPGPGGVPCYGFAGGTFAKVSNCSQVLPQACIDAAASLPNNPALSSTPTTAGLPAGAPALAPNTAMYNLYKYGCYVSTNGKSVMLPPAQGTQGNMTRNMLRGIYQRQWDASVTKEWKLTERLSSQFRFEVYNVTNGVKYASPATNLGQPSTFGVARATLNLGGIAIAAGAPRQMQMGLKLIF